MIAPMGAFSGFAVIWGVVATGWVFAHLKVFDVTAQRALSNAAYFIGTPALMFTSLRHAELARVFSMNVIVSSLAIIVTAAAYILIARLAWKRELGHLVIGSFASSYVNANNMGLPIALYVVGDTSWVAPILLIQAVVLQPIGLAILDVQRAKHAGKQLSVVSYITLPFRNPITIGVLGGLIFNLAGWPVHTTINDFLELLGGLAVPAMLIAFGISLKLGPKPGVGNAKETITTSVLKVIVHPLVAFAIGLAFGLDADTLFAVVVMAGLPTAQNVFVFAMRADVSVQLARDTIFITSFASIVTILSFSVIHSL